MRVLFGSIALVVVLGVGVVVAQERGGRAPVPQSAPPPPAKPIAFDVDAFIKQFDKNGDGYLQAEEMPPEVRSAFERIDANKDGKLSREELVRGVGHLQSRPRASDVISMLIEMSDFDNDSRGDLQRAYEILLSLDKNRDGKIDEDELKVGRARILKSRIDSLFKQLDTDNDGLISREEAKGQVRQDFNAIDLNHDGFIDRDELMRAATARPSQPPAGREGERRPAPPPRPRGR